MSNFLEGYEDVNARIIRARAEFPTMRLVAYIEDIDITKGYRLCILTFCPHTDTTNAERATRLVA